MTTSCEIVNAIDTIAGISIHPCFDLKGRSDKLDDLWAAYERARAAAGIPPNEGYASIPRGAHCPELFGLLRAVTDMTKHGAVCFSDEEFETANRAIEDPKFQAFLIARRGLENAITRFMKTV